MKHIFILISTFLSLAAIAQPTVTVRTAPAGDTVVITPQSTITLTGTATQANPGHPILDTTWTETSGPSSAVITNPTNRMTTKVTGLVTGTYVFTLTATDKQRSASAPLTVRVLPGTLAITLASFTATPNDAGTLLNWTTTTETDNATFIIQESTTGNDFTDIATVASKAVNGSSNVPASYSYQVIAKITNAGIGSILAILILLPTLGRIVKGKNLRWALAILPAFLFLISCTKSVSLPITSQSTKTEYRLKIVDKDGIATYSPIVVL